VRRLILPAMLALALPASASAQGIDEFALPAGSAPTFITTGHDERLWFAKHGVGEIGRIGTNGVLQQSIPSRPNPIDVAAGPDGSMYWINHSHTQRRTAGGTITERQLVNHSGYAIATSATEVWWTQIDSGSNSDLSFLMSGELSLTGPYGGVGFVPAVNGVPRLTDVTIAPDGKPWLTLYEGAAIFRLSAAKARELRNDLAPGTLPYRITPGPDGAMWFTEQGGNAIGRITNAGVVTEFPLPRPNSGPYDIVAGPDGALWFTEFNPAGNAIGRITTDGKVTEYAIPTPASNPWGIAVGPDGKIWFAESATHKIGRLDPATAVPIGGRGGPGGGGPGADRTKPAFQGHVTISRRRFSVGRAATPFTIAQAVPSGTTFRFNLSEPARVTVKIQRKARGRRVRGRCRVNARGGRRCTLWKSAGRSLTRQGLQGSNSIAFSGRLGRKALAVGSYRALITATDAAGNRSRTAKLGFAIVARRR
jgi:virginiamycin B lyase